MITRIIAILILILSIFSPATPVQGYQDHPDGVMSGLDTPKSVPNPQMKIVAIPKDTDSSAEGNTINGLILTILVVVLVLIAGLIYLMVRKNQY